MAARSSASCCSVSPLRVGVRVIDGVRLITWVGASLEWPAYHLVAPSAVPVSAGRLGDLSGVKVKRYEGFVAKSLSIEIVCVVFTLLSDNARAFLQECQRMRGPHRGPPPRVGHSPRGLRWGEIGLSFSWKIEIAFHFNSKLNFDN